MLLNTSLSLSVMQAPSGRLLAWVTSTAPGSGPVAGAAVSFHALNGGAGMQLLGSCVTGTDGTCALPDDAMPPGVRKGHGARVQVTCKQQVVHQRSQTLP